MRRRQFVYFFIGLISFLSCKKDEDLHKATGSLCDLTSTNGGCGWTISLDHPDRENFTTVEPVNLENFNIRLENGRCVNFTYKETNRTTPCNVGRSIELRKITEQ